MADLEVTIEPQNGSGPFLAVGPYRVFPVRRIYHPDGGDMARRPTGIMLSASGTIGIPEGRLSDVNPGEKIKMTARRDGEVVDEIQAGVGNVSLEEGIWTAEFSSIGKCTIKSAEFSVQRDP